MEDSATMFAVIETYRSLRYVDDKVTYVEKFIKMFEKLSTPMRN